MQLHWGMELYWLITFYIYRNLKKMNWSTFSDLFPEPVRVAWLPFSALTAPPEKTASVEWLPANHPLWRAKCSLPAFGAIGWLWNSQRKDKESSCPVPTHPPGTQGSWTAEGAEGGSPQFVNTIQGDKSQHQRLVLQFPHKEDGGGKGAFFPREKTHLPISSWGCSERRQSALVAPFAASHLQLFQVPLLCFTDFTF